MSEQLSAPYTLRNHLQQDRDHYAVAKYEIVRRMLAQYARPGMTLLNVGCGAGYFNRVAHDLGLSIVACEPDPVAYEIAQEDAPDDCTIYNCDPAAFAAMGHTTDFMVRIEVLEHIEDDAEAVAQLHPMLKPGGRAIITVPALPWLYGSHDVNLGHFRRYSARALRRLLSREFAIHRMRYFGALSIPLVVLFSQLLRRDYPREEGREGWIGRLYGAICRFETTVSLPIGTSLIAEVKPHQDNLAATLRP